MKSWLVLLVCLPFSLPVFSAESIEERLARIEEQLNHPKEDPVRFGAMIDLYYQWDFNRPRAGVSIPYKNYTNKHNDFTVNLFEVNIYKKFKNLELYADIDFGEQPEQNRPHNDDPVTHHLGQALLRYNVEDVKNLVISGGKFYSHFGYEVPKNIENRTYSRPFYFTLVCPFWHEGIALTQQGIGGHYGYGLYLYDRTDYRVENNSGKTYGGQLSYTSEKFVSAYNLITGAETADEGEKKTMHELILTYHLNSRLDLVLDLVTGKNSPTVQYKGLVGYADFKTSERNSLNLRYEAFHDDSSQGSLFVTTDNLNVAPPKVDGYTLTNRYKLRNGAEVRAEYRMDRATSELFPSHGGSFRKSQNTITLGVLYAI